MILRHLGAGALALAMLVVILTPAAAKQCVQAWPPGTYKIIDPCPPGYTGRAAKQSRRGFRGHEAKREARRHHVRVRADRNVGAGGGSADVRNLVTAAAHAAGVPASIAHAVVRVESGYRIHLRGAAGEWGLGQIKCQTARSVGFAGSCGGLADAATNLRYSMAYLASALRKGGVGCSGVSLYQRGIFGRPGCTGYGRKVMAMAGTGS